VEWADRPVEEVFDLGEWIEAVRVREKPKESLVADMKKINDALDNADCGVIETIMEIKPNHYIYSVDKTDGSKGEWYGWNDTRWEKSDAPLKKAIMYNVPDYWRSIIKKWDEEFEDMEFEEGDEPDNNYK